MEKMKKSQNKRENEKKPGKSTGRLRWIKKRNAYTMSKTLNFVS